MLSTPRADPKLRMALAAMRRRLAVRHTAVCERRRWKVHSAVARRQEQTTFALCTAGHAASALAPCSSSLTPLVAGSSFPRRFLHPAWSPCAASACRFAHAQLLLPPSALREGRSPASHIGCGGRYCLRRRDAGRIQPREGDLATCSLRRRLARGCRRCMKVIGGDRKEEKS